MRFEIFKGEQLAASLEYGWPPAYHGPVGRQIAELIASNEVVYNLWTQEMGAGTLADTPDWWASRIISAPLARAGFVLAIAECGARSAE